MTIFPKVRKDIGFPIFVKDSMGNKRFWTYNTLVCDIILEEDYDRWVDQNFNGPIFSKTPRKGR